MPHCFLCRTHAYLRARFQSDHDLDIVCDLADEVGLTALQEQHVKTAIAEGIKARNAADPPSGDAAEIEFDYAIEVYRCSHPDKVREYLDAGALDDFFAKHKDAMLTGKDGYYGQGYKCIILAASAMLLGCKLRPNTRKLLKKSYVRV